MNFTCCNCQYTKAIKPDQYRAFRLKYVESGNVRCPKCSSATPLDVNQRRSLGMPKPAFASKPAKSDLPVTLSILGTLSMWQVWVVAMLTGFGFANATGENLIVCLLVFLLLSILPGMAIRYAFEFAAKVIELLER